MSQSLHRQIKNVTNIQKLCVQPFPETNVSEPGERQGRVGKVKENKIFLKLYWDKGKENFISLEGYFALLLKLYICDFYIYLPVFEIQLIF